MTHHEEYPGYVLWMTGLSDAGSAARAVLLVSALSFRAIFVAIFVAS